MQVSWHVRLGVALALFLLIIDFSEKFLPSVKEENMVVIKKNHREHDSMAIS